MHEERSDRISAWKILVNTVRKTLEIRRKNSNQVLSTQHQHTQNNQLFYHIVEYTDIEGTRFRNIINSNRLDHVAQLTEHLTSIPKVAGSIPTVHGQANFSACLVWMHTQSNITNINRKNVTNLPYCRLRAVPQ